MERARIVHVHANTLARVGLQAVLNGHKQVEHIYTIAEQDNLLPSIKKYDANLLIAGHDGAQDLPTHSLKKARETYPHLKILVISGEVQHAKVLEALESGVEGFLTSECDEGEIISAISSLVKGEKFYCNKVINIILEKKLSPEEEDCDPTTLTQRETEVTGLIAKGLTNRKIAEELFLSPHTVNTHRKNIMKKLGVNSTSGLVLYAVNAGLVKPEEIVS